MAGLAGPVLQGKPTRAPDRSTEGMKAMLDTVSKVGLGSKITVLNPVGYPPKVTAKTTAPRLESLDGKTIYLVSDGFAGADRFLNQIAIWFQKNMPGVKTVYRLKAGSYFDDDPKLTAEIKASGSAMIMAYGH